MPNPILFEELDDIPDEADPHEEKFDFSSPEDVLFEVVGPHEPDKPLDNWDNWSIESTTVINMANPDVTGAASYDANYGVGLDYLIKSSTTPPGEGWFVMPGVTGVYHKGDGWMTDDDMDFNFGEIRPATEDEIKQA